MGIMNLKMRRLCCIFITASLRTPLIYFIDTFERMSNMAARAEQPVETIKMVENAMGVLDLLRTSKVPLGVNEIAKTCGLNPSTTFRILKTLETSGWIYKTNDDRYITGQNYYVDGGKSL